MREMTPSELKSKLEAGNAVDVVDVREAAEFAAWHIRGSSNLPIIEDLRQNRAAALVRASESLSKERPLVMVCRRGAMAQRAAQLLTDLGFDAACLTGGIQGWPDQFRDCVHRDPAE
jgi:rhodanese-related sulfurtransferase